MISLARAVLSDMSSCTFMFEESVAFAFLVSSPLLLLFVISILLLLAVIRMV